MKCLALFRGEVTCVLPGATRIVRMWRPFKKDSEEIIADMKRTHCKGFKVGQLFEARVMQEKGKPAFMQVTKWTPKPLSPRTIARIQREVEEMTKGIDWDNV